MKTLIVKEYCPFSIIAEIWGALILFFLHDNFIKVQTPGLLITFEFSGKGVSTSSFCLCPHVKEIVNSELAKVMTTLIKDPFSETPN
jgi:hypothetical protein